MLILLWCYKRIIMPREKTKRIDTSLMFLLVQSTEYLVLGHIAKSHNKCQFDTG